MKTLTFYYRKVELFFGSLKFAVFIILLFAILLCYGTFMESYHGTEYANRLVYKAYYFMGVQLCMFLSILFATLIRLPPKKHLYGFYVIHAGLIILFIGSFITYQSGIDGNMTLAPNLASRHIRLNEDEFQIQFPVKGKEVTVDLPFNARPTDLDLEYEGIKLKTFLPFAQDSMKWISTGSANQAETSSRYRIYNENFGEFVTLSLHPKSDYTNSTQMGPLNVHYMPTSIAKCFTSNTKEGLIVWDANTTDCFAPDTKDLKVVSSISGRKQVEVTFKGEKINFLPEMSPLPLDKKKELDENSPYRAFSKKLFESNPHLFLFGKNIAFYNKEEKKWEGASIELNTDAELPWMGLKVRLMDYKEDAYPVNEPEYVKPVQENSQVILGDLKAIEVEIEGTSFWVKSGEPVAYNLNGERIRMELGKRLITLPYEIVLDQFKMDTDPGTNNPASFESFVTVFKGDQGSEKHHVFMNHPLKYEDFTFYQASYFQTQQGPYGSVLSVNYDPGRAWKYFGSLLLVLGSIWHYFLRRKHLAKPGVKNE